MHRGLFIAAALFLSATPSRFDPPRDLPGQHNVHKAAETVYLGSEPHGDDAAVAERDMAALKQKCSQCHAEYRNQQGGYSRMS